MPETSRVRAFLHGYGRLTIFMLPIGIGINFVGAQIALLTKVPVYLDSIGTILVGALCGGLPGAAVAILSTLINSITIPTAIPYGTLAVLFGLMAGFASRRGWLRKIWTTVPLAIPFGIVGGGGGTVITLLLFGGLGGSSGSDIIVAGLVATGVPVVLANIVSYVPLDTLDKLCDLLIVFILISRLPVRLLTKLPLGSIYVKKRRTVAATPVVS